MKHNIDAALQARMTAALDATMSHNGQIQTRRAIVEELVAGGATIEPHPKDGRRLTKTAFGSPFVRLENSERSRRNHRVSHH